ncbi:MAG TPA: hypothetical protein VF721_12255 [Pyrinomonadaceae bacterium]
MSDSKETKKIVADLERAYNEMVDSFSLKELISHRRAEIKVLKTERIHNPSKAFSAEKIAALEKAVGKFEVVYRTEKAGKMPLLRREAGRLRKLFDEDDAQTLNDFRIEHKLSH